MSNTMPKCKNCKKHDDCRNNKQKRLMTILNWISLFLWLVVGVITMYQDEIMLYQYGLTWFVLIVVLLEKALTAGGGA